MHEKIKEITSMQTQKHKLKNTCVYFFFFNQKQNNIYNSLFISMKKNFNNIKANYCFELSDPDLEVMDQ